MFNPYHLGRRRHKRIDRLLAKKRKDLDTLTKKYDRHPIIAERTPIGYEYQLHLEITPDPQLVEPLRIQADCFVLIANLDSPEDRDHFSAEELLWLYKNQDGIERNFFYDDNQVSQYTRFESRTSTKKLRMCASTT